jgi:hypothetical protein
MAPQAAAAARQGRTGTELATAVVTWPEAECTGNTAMQIDVTRAPVLARVTSGHRGHHSSSIAALLRSGGSRFTDAGNYGKTMKGSVSAWNRHFPRLRHPRLQAAPAGAPATRPKAPPPVIPGTFCQHRPLRSAADSPEGAVRVDLDELAEHWTLFSPRTLGATTRRPASASAAVPHTADECRPADCL